MGLFRRRNAQTPNAVTQPLTTYGPDPVGAAMFGTLAQRAGLDLTVQRAVVAPAAFSGWAQAPQGFRGAAYLGANPITYTPATSSIDQEKSVPLSDPALSILFARSGRRQ